MQTERNSSAALTNSHRFQSHLRQELQRQARILQEAWRVPMQGRLARQELRPVLSVSGVQKRRLPAAVGMQLQVSSIAIESSNRAQLMLLSFYRI